jgi:hypothetical protein
MRRGTKGRCGAAKRIDGAMAMREGYVFSLNAFRRFATALLQAQRD